MTASEPQHPTHTTLFDRTMIGREAAEALLRSLIDVRSASARTMSALKRPQLVQPAGADNGIEKAINAARGLVEAYNQQLADMGVPSDADAVFGTLSAQQTEHEDHRPGPYKLAA